MGMDATRVVIFDCDGVLFDSKEANIAFYNQILAQFHLHPMTREEVEYVHISTAEGALRYLLARRDLNVLEELLAHRPRVDYTPFIRLMHMEPHLKELLGSLPPQIKRAVSNVGGFRIRAPPDLPRSQVRVARLSMSVTRSHGLGRATSA